MRALTALFAGLIWAHVSCAAPAARFSRRVWRIEDGLPQSKIQAFAQTPDGYLWIGTSGGLVRFDGARFTVFDRSNTDSLRDDSILSLLSAQDGSLWIGTEGGGMAHMQKGVFRAFGSAEGLTNGFVRVMLEDSRKRFWVGTDRGFFQLENGRFTRFDSKGSVPPLAAHAVAEDSNGTVHVGTSYGLFRMERGAMVKSSDGTDAIGDITGIYETPEHDLWLASVTGTHRLSHGKLVPDCRVDAIKARRIYSDHAGNAWLGTIGEGLTRIARTGDEPALMLSAPDPLPDNTVLAIFEDMQRNLWIGTNDGMLRLTQTAVRTFNKGDGMAEDNVVTVYSDPAGSVWLATALGFLYRVDGIRPVRYEPPKAPAGFTARNVYAGRDGVRWFGSSTSGLLRVDGSSTLLLSMANGLRSNGIRDFLQTGDGAMWFATGSGLSHWDGKSIKTYYIEDGLAYGGLRALAEDRNGDLLVASDGGVNRVRAGRFLRDSSLDRFRGEKVWTILVDADGVIWLGTRGDGLVRIEGERLTRFTTKQGLPGNSIYKILDDGEGRLWMSGASGVFSALRKDLESVARGATSSLAVIPFDTDDGMLTSQMNGGAQSAGARDRNGNLWFPSVKGAVRIDPSQLHALPASPVLIEALLIDERPQPTDGTISIPPGSKSIEIDFASPNLAAPDRVSFRYMLEGFDKTWLPSMRRRAAYYTNLPPRRYRFRVIAADVAQPNHTSEAVLDFELLPHFYETLWFYGLAMLAVALAVFAGFRLYARQTRARYALVLAERTRLAREMHDTVIQGCVGVSTLIEAARSMPPSAEAKTKDLIDRAASQIRATVNEAREAVWDLRHSTIEQGLAGTLRGFVQQVAAAEGVAIEVVTEGAPTTVDDMVSRNLLLVAREAVRNAVLHGVAKHVEVKLHFEGSGVALEVRDDGHGFDTNQPQADGHYGIVGMKERVEQSGGIFDIRSAPGAGTTVTARLPLKKQERRKHARA